jgi:hypothetical protein
MLKAASLSPSLSRVVSLAEMHPCLTLSLLKGLSRYASDFGRCSLLIRLGRGVEDLDERGDGGIRAIAR